MTDALESHPIQFNCQHVLVFAFSCSVLKDGNSIIYTAKQEDAYTSCLLLRSADKAAQ